MARCYHTASGRYGPKNKRSARGAIFIGVSLLRLPWSLINLDSDERKLTLTQPFVIGRWPLLICIFLSFHRFSSSRRGILAGGGGGRGRSGARSAISPLPIHSSSGCNRLICIFSRGARGRSWFAYYPARGLIRTGFANLHILLICTFTSRRCSFAYRGHVAPDLHIQHRAVLNEDLRRIKAEAQRNDHSNH